MNLDVDSLQPTWRLWGEEKEEGVIYTVYLKKVRYHRPTKSISSDSEDEISHLEWETVRIRFVKAATLEKLVENLVTDDGELESTYINVFLATYRTFATPKQLLQLLVKRFKQLVDSDRKDALNQQHRKTLVLALRVWLDSYPEDFREPLVHSNLNDLLDFTQQYLPGSELEVKVKHRLDRFIRDDQYIDSGFLYSNNFVIHANGTSTSQGTVYKFPNVPEKHFAEQLTRMDMELFKKLVPHQCLGAIWSRRDKSRSQEAATVLATVNQFNAVSFRVISTILVDPDLKHADRAAVISAWIDIAQELRVLKNFSSLKAIISGLQSNPVYRLDRTWAALARDKVELFEELARIFSEENNQWAQRELLIREGTAKFADTVGQNDKQLQKVFQKRLNNAGSISHGTIPYLGTFLTDLTMIDTAIPDTVADGLINFDKRRKEFEVLAQIKLLQGAANAYNIPQDPLFDCWFDSLLVLDDREAYQLSCQIETPPPGSLNVSSSRYKKRCGHRKNDSIASTGSSSSSSQFYYDLESAPSSQQNSLDRKLSSSSSNSSLPSLDVSISSNNTNQSSGNKNQSTPTPTSNSQNKLSTDFYIIRVTMETDSGATDGIVMYKSIMLSNNERTPQVIRNAMMKLGLEGNPDSYSLAQVLPDKECSSSVEDGFSIKCVLGFTPFSASILFGLSLVALLIKHPELYPCWLRRVNCKIMFLYELFASLIFIEIGFCVWNSLETFLFYRIPSFLEEHCNQLGDLYIRVVETEVGVSLISNMLALTLLLFTLHITRVCNFNLLLKTNGVHKFFADAGLTSKLCRHHRELRQYTKESSTTGSNCPISLSNCSPCRPCITPKLMANRCPKMLRSGKKFY